MRVRNLRCGAERVIELVEGFDGYTVADLAAALDCAARRRGASAAGISVDGCWHPADTPLAAAAIWEGSLLEVLDPPEDRCTPSLPSSLLHTTSRTSGGQSQPQGSDGVPRSGRGERARASGGQSQPQGVDRVPRSVRGEPARASGSQGRPQTSDGVPRSSTPRGLSGERALPGGGESRRRGASGSSRVVAVTGGIRSGPSLPSPSSGSWVVGRAEACDLVLADAAASHRHARIVFRGDREQPVVSDLGSRNGTLVDSRELTETTGTLAGATVRVGATTLQWRVVRDDAPTAFRAGLGARAGRIPFNRPPRRRPPVTPTALTVPAQASSPPTVEPLSRVGVVLPLAAGLLLALVWNPFMAVFAVLGPTIAVGTWLERRRRARRSHQAACREVAEQVQRLKEELPRRRAAERRRMLSLVPDPAEVLRRAANPSVRCWERRAWDPDVMRLGVGSADVPFAPTLRIAGDGPAAPEALAAIRDLGPLPDVPVAVSAAPGSVIGIVGDGAVARAVARSLVVQASVLHGPADVAIACLSNPEISAAACPAGLDGGLIACPAGPGAGWVGCGGELGAGRVGAAPRCEVDGWSWMRWLPHAADPQTGEPGGLVADSDRSAAEVVAAVSAAPPAPARMLLAVIDDLKALTGRGAAGRALLNLKNAAAVVVAPEISDLPSACTTIVEVAHPVGGLRLLDPRSAVALEPVIAWGMTVETATEAAARLARLEDPELGTAGALLPEAAALVDLVGADITAAGVARRWDERSAAEAAFSAPIGSAADGPLELDLVADGPHLLIGGTTGSGKSELLRSLVAGLAMSASPDELAFVLIDYKGGAAFDRCAEMPHTAGMVTDLDERLAERALVCLEAELRHREERLRAARVEDLSALHARLRADEQAPVRQEPLPRLVVAVDEFATLAAELPEFLSSLVGIAQRGRSLGVHMVLATQRPAGVVTEDIRANTSCRIALRVTDRQDSNDVIGAPDAAQIPRKRPGRALARFGPTELIGFQAALVTGVTETAARGLRIRERRPFKPQPPTDPRAAPPAGAQLGGAVRSDLDRIVEAVTQAHANRGGRPPRSPWPSPLPKDLSSESLAARASPGEPASWLVDDPANQRQFLGGWTRKDGNLAVIGGPASGKTTTLAALTMDLCRVHSADELNVYGIDLDAGKLTALRVLPHAGAVIAPTDAERRLRLLRMLDDEVSARRERVENSVSAASEMYGVSAAPAPGVSAAPTSRVSGVSAAPTSGDRERGAGASAVRADAAAAGDDDPQPGAPVVRVGASRPVREPRIVLVVDDLAGLTRCHDPIREPEPHERLARIWNEGPAVGVLLAVSLGRAADLPADMASSAGLVLLHATADAGEGLRFGVRAANTGLPPGRAVRADDGREVQVARPDGGDFAAACARLAASAAQPVSAPASVGSLPAKIAAHDLPVGGTVRERHMGLRFAMSDSTLQPVGFGLHDGEHALVLGPAGSGRTETLAAIGAAARAAGVAVTVVADDRSDLAARLGVTAASPGELDGAWNGAARRVLLIDATGSLDDDPVLARFVRAPATRWHAVVAATADRVRSSYGHWLYELRSCRAGVLFKPGPLDGEILGAALPPRLTLPSIPGRGLIVAEGVASVAQMALLATADPPESALQERAP